MTTFVFQPILPKLAIFRIDTEEQVKEIGEFLRTHASLFVGLPFQFNASRMRVRKEGSYIPAPNDREEATDIFSIGDYLVTSENGKRYFTKSMIVMRSAWADFPAELFVPIEGVKLDEPNFANFGN